MTRRRSVSTGSEDDAGLAPHIDRFTLSATGFSQDGERRGVKIEALAT